MQEIHEGIVGNHSGGGSLAQKIVHQGYYWPTIRHDDQDITRACDKCQRYAKYSNLPAARLTFLSSPWLFAMWGIDLIGELPMDRGCQICDGHGLLQQIGRSRDPSYHLC